jgi:hypothetical protein
VRSLIWIFWCASLLALSVHARAADNADWMRGNWGVRVVVPAGNNKLVRNFDAAALVQQLGTLRTPQWVMVNATQGGYGGKLTTPNEALRGLDASLVPERDLLGEIIALLHQRGFRVVTYFAAEGPRGLELDDAQGAMAAQQSRTRDQMQSVRSRWDREIDARKISNTEAVAMQILEPLAERFGPEIDGWWFDHGKWGDAKRYAAVVRQANPRAVIAWNEAHEMLRADASGDSQQAQVWGLARSNEFEDYTAGHVTPPARMAPWDDANEQLIMQVERQGKHGTAEIQGLVPHVLIPLQRGWLQGKADFPSEKVFDWTERLLEAGGAITWSVLLEDPESAGGKLGRRQFEQLVALDERLLSAGHATERAGLRSSH